MDVHIVYFVVPNEEEAEAIAATLIQERLAACVNILGGRMRSIYEWEGSLVRTEEIAVIAKTSDDRLQAAIEQIKAKHSYTCPAIVSWPVIKGHGPFLDWIESQCKKDLELRSGR